MEQNNWIKDGDWFCAIEGLAIADKVFNFYYEEFSKLPEGKEIGDYHLSMIRYRLFCDYEGNPIKRNRCKIFNLRFCSPIKLKYTKLLNKSIKSYPKEYSSFIKFLNTPKETKGSIHLEYAISMEDKMRVVQEFEIIKNKLPYKFTFLDLIDTAANCQCIVNMHDFLNDTFEVPLYVRIYLTYTYGDYKDKRIMFSGLNYEFAGRLHQINNDG